MNRHNIHKLSIFHFILISALLVLVSAGRLSGQSDDQIQSILSNSDKSKLDKANEYKSQGDALIEEANQLYMETFAVQADVQLDEKKMKKKVEQLESKAQQKHFAALELYDKCNEQKYGIYKKYIEKFWGDFSGDENNYVNARLIEEQSNDYFYQAITTRNDAGKVRDSKDKIQKLNDANDLQIRSLEKQITALGIYYSIDTTPAQIASTQPQEPVYQPVQPTEYQAPSTPPASTPEYTTPVSTPEYSAPVSTPEYTPVRPDQTAPGDVQVNQEILDMYNRYLSDTLNGGGNFLTPEMLARIGSFDVYQILNIWYNYAYDQSYSPEYEEQLFSELQSRFADSIPEDLSVEQYQEYQDLTVQDKKIS